MTDTPHTSWLTTYTTRLQKALNPTFLACEDFSQQHSGHFTPQRGPSHLLIRICSNQLDGLNTVRQHQAIYRLFHEELATGAIHALRIEVLDKPPSPPTT